VTFAKGELVCVVVQDFCQNAITTQRKDFNERYGAHQVRKMPGHIFYANSQRKFTYENEWLTLCIGTSDIKLIKILHHPE